MPCFRYNYIYEVIQEPPYLKGQSARPYVQAYAKPSDTALAVKQELYYLDLQVRLSALHSWHHGVHLQR